MLRRKLMNILSIVVVISMVFGPFVSSVQAAEMYRVGQEDALNAPSERFNDWPHPQNPIGELDMFMDPVDAALEIATSGIIDTELLEDVVQIERLPSPSLVEEQVKLPATSVAIPTTINPLVQTDIQESQPWDLGTFLEQDKNDELRYDTEDDSSEETAITRVWNWSIKQLFNLRQTPVDDTTTVPVEDTDAPLSVATLPVKPTVAPDAFTDGIERNQSLYTIYLPLVLRMSRGLPPSPVQDEVVITTMGGTLITTDFLFRVDVPANAYPAAFRLRYTPAPERGGLPNLAATTLDGEPIVLQRAARISMRLPDPEYRSGRSLFFRQHATGSQRTVSIAASVVPNTIANPGEQPLTSDMLSAYVYEFGQFTFASLVSTLAVALGKAPGLMQVDEEENPDEGDDGLVIESLCFELAEQGPLYTFPIATIYTTTEEADPWGFLDIFWDEIVGYDDDGYPIIETQYDPNNSYREDLERMTYLDDEGLFMGIQEVGEYEPGTVLSFTLYVDDLGGPDGGYRYDSLDDGLFQAGFEGCVSGTCEAVAPTIGAIKVAQSGQQKNSSYGTCWVSVAADDNSGTPTLSMTFNGQSYSDFQSMSDGTMGVEVAECYLNDYNYMQVSAVDECGNTSTTPEISIWGTGAVGFGPYACGPNCGYQGSALDPVNTFNGNYFDDVTDLVVAGVGNTDLIVSRAYNSTAVLWTGATEMEYSGFGDGDTYTEEPAAGPPQYFGPGWTFPYATYLLVIDKLPFYEGVQIQYSSGQTVNFVKEGDGYTPEAPGNFDTLTIEGDEYVLRHKRTLEVERFNSDGQLVAKEDRNGNRVTMIYDGDLLTRVENNSGRWIEFTYNGEGLIEAINASESRTLTYSYTDGLLTGFTNGEEYTTTYTYNDLGMLIAITTPKGHTSMEQTYDEKNRVNWQKAGRAAINSIAYTENADGTITTITDAYSNTTTYIYNNIGQLMETVYADGNTEAFDYDEDYNRIYYKDKEDREWHYTFNDAGMRTCEDGPMEWYREWDYNNLNLATRMEDAEGRETFFDYDAKGNLIQITNALSATSTIIYDERGLPTHIFDFNHNETVNTYDPVTGDLLSTTNGAGDTNAYTYDDLGRMRTMTDGIDAVYEYTYDGNDNLTDINGPMSYHLGFRYDENDNLKQEIDPKDGVTEYWYDESELVVRVENQLHFPTLFTYDDMDNLIQVEDAEGRVWTYDYDAVYNRVAEHGPEDTLTLYTYDGVGNVTNVTRCNSALSGDTCPVNQVTHFEYDDLDRVETMVQNYKPGEDASPDTNVTTTYEYDLVGNLKKLVDANGNPTRYDYNALDLLIRVEDAENQVTEYDYDANGNMIWLRNPREYETTFTYDVANRLETRTDAAESTWTYIYDGNGNLTDEIDPHDVVTHYDYDLLNRVQQLAQNYIPGGAATTDQNVMTAFEYDPAGNLLVIHDPRGTYQTRHEYDAAHRRITTIDAELGKTEFIYDDVNNLTHIIDANDHETEMAYDGLNRQVSITNPEGHSVAFEYDRLGNLLTMTDARGYPTTFAYDGMMRMILRVDALDGEWHNEYDAMGNLMRHIDANTHVNNAYTYDKVYRVLTITDGEGYITDFTYDKNGNRLTLTDGNTHTTTYTYDELDRVSTVTNAENETTEYRYDKVGNQTQLIEADAVVTLYDYDPLYRLSAVTLNYLPGEPESADVNVDTHYGYDEAGNLISIVDAEEHATTFFYNGLNLLVKEVDALGNTWNYAYDPVGNRTARIDAKRNRTAYDYYPDDQLQQIAYYDGTSVAFTYDENNNRLTMDDHLGLTTWDYDPLNRVTDVTDPFARHLGYGYDAVGNHTSLTYADGRTVNYTYYRNNWLKTAVDPEDNVTMYERDGVGQVTRQLNPNSTIAEMTYDKANRLLTLRNYQVEGARKTNSAFDYTYNEVGHRIQTVAEYAWRKPNEIITSTYTYDPLRRLIRDEDSRGVWTDYTFDRVGNRLTLVTNDDSLSPRPFDEKTLVYTYNDINQALTIVGDTHPGSPSVKRTDNVAQAIHAFRHEVEAQRGKHIEPTAADTLLAMADAFITNLYDNPVPDELEVETALIALRAQVESDHAAGTIDNEGTANSLLVKLRLGDDANNGVAGELQTTTFLYDANGNRINKEFPGPQGPRIQGTDYTYDPENRLIVAHDYQENLNGNRVDRQITRLDYDGDGRRLVKEYDPKDGGGGTKRVEYVFDGLDPVAEYNIWNPQYENFYRADRGRIITMHHFPAGTQGQMYWFHYDGLGSTSGLTKQNGQSSHNYRYEPYGQIEMPPGNFTDPHNHYTFTGQELDENMGLYEFYARAYDYDTGTWLQQDLYRGQLTYPTMLHRYGYVSNSPTNFTDYYGYAYCLIYGCVPEIVISTKVVIAIGATAVTLIGLAIYADNYDSINESVEDTVDATEEITKEVVDEVGDAGVCELRYADCYMNPWQPSWNQYLFGPKKDCFSCRRECYHTDGIWPDYKCPPSFMTTPPQ